MVRPVNVLMVEDSEDDARLLQLELGLEGFLPDITRVDTRNDLRAALTERRFDVVISDHNMPGFSGDEALAMVKRFNPDLPSSWCPAPAAKSTLLRRCARAQMTSL